MESIAGPKESLSWGFKWGPGSQHNEAEIEAECLNIRVEVFVFQCLSSEQKTHTLAGNTVGTDTFQCPV